MELKSIHKYRNLLKGIAILVLVYLFLLSITIIGSSLKMMGADFATKVMQGVSNPFVGLMVGILTTAIVQSSSLTTSLVVSMVAGDVLTIGLAIPIVMGANIGTTITNVLVSIGHIGKKDDFERAFAAATVHDFFNILAVLSLFPLQYFFNIIGRSAHFIAELFENVGGLRLINPLGKILDPVAMRICGLFPEHLWLNIILAFVLLFVALTFLVNIIKSLVLAKVEVFFDQYIFKNTLRAFLLGLVLTTIVQSSSITTSLVVPLAAAGILTLKKIYPYDLGANIGTTITAFLAALATGNINAITIAFSHTLFNIFGTCIFLPLQRLPIALARGLASLTRRNRIYAIVYVATLFFIIPIILIFISR